MSIKEQIEESKGKISRLKSNIRSTETKIRSEESKKRQAESSRTMGMVYFANPTLRPYGTYKYISSSNNVTSLTSSISRLKSKKSNLESELHREESNLKALEQKYKNRPEATLVVGENGVYIEGDPTKRDILTAVYNKIDRYISEHQKIRSSESVAKYLELTQTLETDVAKSNLPEATKNNIEELKILKNRLMSNFRYVVVGDKVLVDSDFISHPIAIAEDKVKNLQVKIDDNQARRDNFEPTFWGKIFKGVREKQMQELEDKIKRVDFEYKTYQGEAQADAKYYSEVKTKYVEPSIEFMEVLGKLKRLASSYDVSKYLNNEEKYKKDLDPSTILKDIGITDLPTEVMRNIQGYLDNHDLKLSKEAILEAILACPYYKELAEQIKPKTSTAPESKASDENGYGL